MSKTPQILSTKLRTVLSQFPYVPRTFGLVAGSQRLDCCVDRPLNHSRRPARDYGVSNQACRGWTCKSARDQIVHGRTSVPVLILHRHSRVGAAADRGVRGISPGVARFNRSFGKTISLT